MLVVVAVVAQVVAVEALEVLVEVVLEPIKLLLQQPERQTQAVAVAAVTETQAHFY
jgi:hypothetical protein